MKLMLKTAHYSRGHRSMTKTTTLQLLNLITPRVTFNHVAHPENRRGFHNTPAVLI